jgi:multiple sugar transport system permease protein
MSQVSRARKHGNKALRRVLTFYLPLALFIVFLLFPFYWMIITAIKPNAELIPRGNFLEVNPFVVKNPTLEHFGYLFTETRFPRWFANTLTIALSATSITVVASFLAAFGITRIRFPGASGFGFAIYLAYLVPPALLFIPLANILIRLRLFDSILGLILIYPTFLLPFCTWLLIGFLKTIPHELEEAARLDGANWWQIMTQVILPLSVPGLISSTIFCFTLSGEEFLYALVFISSPNNKTISVGLITELVRGDVFQWGPLMAGALIAALPVLIIYFFFNEYYVQGLSGALKD